MWVLWGPRCHPMMFAVPFCSLWAISWTLLESNYCKPFVFFFGAHLGPLLRCLVILPMEVPVSNVKAGGQARWNEGGMDGAHKVGPGLFGPIN